MVHLFADPSPSNGNRTGGSYSTGTANRITADGTYTYQYDKEGNRTRRTKNSDSSYEEYTWDFRNRLVKVDFKTSGGSVTKWIEYAYDPFNRLVRRTIDPDGAGGASATDQFFAGYDGIHATLEFDGDEDSDVSHRYLWGVGFDMLLADEQVSSVSSAGNVLWPLADHLGTIRDIADYDEGDPDFAITNHRVYDSFGRLESETNSAVDLSFGFTGKFTDDATGHTHHLNRWYDPTTARWLSEDPIGFAAGDANLSRYVGNKPAQFVDPLGLSELGPGNPGFNAEVTNSGFDDWLDNLANFSAGLGDAMSFGIGWYVRGAIIGNDMIDSDSGAYSAGGWTGVGVDIASGGILIKGAARQGARQVITGGRQVIKNGAKEATESVAEGAIRSIPRTLPWDSWYNLPKVIENGSEYAKIGDRLYTRHAVDRMLPSGLGRPAGGAGAGRSIAPSFVEDVIQNGTKTNIVVDGVPRAIHTSGTVQVVTEQGGRIVVTVNPFSGG